MAFFVAVSYTHLLSRSDMAENVEDAFKYSTLVVAAPSYDGGVCPVMNDFLHHLKIKGYRCV